MHNGIIAGFLTKQSSPHKAAETKQRPSKDAKKASLSYLLFNLCRLTDAITQIVELAAANTAVADGLDLGNIGGMNRENTLHAYAVGNAADGEGLGNSGAVLCNDGSLENLNSLSVSLFDVDV